MILLVGAFCICLVCLNVIIGAIVKNSRVADIVMAVTFVPFLLSGFLFVVLLADKVSP